MNNSTEPSLHVGLNAHLLSGEATYRSAGVHQYVRHLLLHLPAAGCRVTAFVGPTGDGDGAGYTVCRSRWPTQQPGVRVVWEQGVQPWALHRRGVDLAHGPVFVGPLAARCPFVVTIHDLSFLRFPHLFRPLNRLYLTVFARASVRRARRVIAVSADAADETTRLLGVDRGKVDVVYHGVDPEFRPRPQSEVEAFRARRGLPPRFILSVGTLEPRKNLLRLVEAFALLREPGLKLVLVGGRGWHEAALFARVQELHLNDDVIFPGYVPGDELPLWYSAATAVAYPSLYEGFGMPVLEALAAGAAVLTSERSGLPEAAGEGALLVDPCDVQAIADGLRRLLQDHQLRAGLRERGLAHAVRFTWSKTAAATVAVYHRALTLEGRA